MNEDEVLSKIGAHVREERGDDADAEAIVGGDGAERIAARLLSKKKKKSGDVVPFRRRAIAYGAPLAIAAAVALFVATRDHGGGGDLPSYVITASGEEAMRGAPAASGRLRLGKTPRARFEIIARPETAAPDAKVVAYAFAIDSGEPSALDAKVDVSKDGAVRVVGDARQLAAATSIRIVLGAPNEIGNYEGALEHARSGSSDARVRVLSIAIDRD